MPLSLWSENPYCWQLWARNYSDETLSLYEKSIKPDSRRVGKPLAEFPGKGLIVLVRRGEENIIPRGDTILQAGDRIVILDLK